jgi:hypothetical protein
LERTEWQTVAELLKTSLGPPSTRSTLEEVGEPREAIYKRTENGPIAFITTENRIASEQSSALQQDCRTGRVTKFREG